MLFTAIVLFHTRMCEYNSAMAYNVHSNLTKTKYIIKLYSVIRILTDVNGLI